jgi:hypothetical protein
MIIPEAIARAYVSCVELEERLHSESPNLADQMGELRGELHALLMQVFRESGIPFSDRADASRIAFKLTRSSLAK